MSEKAAESALTIARIPIKNGEGEADVTVNGEIVRISAFKREFADVYNLAFVLSTPVADRPARMAFVTASMDNIVSEGPAKDNGWTIDYKPGSISYDYLGRPEGTLALTPKLKAAMVQEGLWGKGSFNGMVMGATSTAELTPIVQKLIAKKVLKSSDVLAMATVFSCTMNK